MEGDDQIKTDNEDSIELGDVEIKITPAGIKALEESKKRFSAPDSLADELLRSNLDLAFASTSEMLNELWSVQDLANYWKNSPPIPISIAPGILSRPFHEEKPDRAMVISEAAIIILGWCRKELAGFPDSINSVNFLLASTREGAAEVCGIYGQTLSAVLLEISTDLFTGLANAVGWNDVLQLMEDAWECKLPRTGGRDDWRAELAPRIASSPVFDQATSQINLDVWADWIGEKLAGLNTNLVRAEIRIEFAKAARFLLSSSELNPAHNFDFGSTTGESPLPRVDQEAKAIALLLTIGPNVSLIARELGVPRSTLRSWPRFRKAIDLARGVAQATKQSNPRGYKTDKGDIEAWQQSSHKEVD